MKAQPNIDFRSMVSYEINKLGDIDRAEQIRVGYRFAEGELHLIQVNLSNQYCKQGIAGKITATLFEEATLSAG